MKIFSMATLWLALCVSALANDISPAGVELAAGLDAMHVDQLWLPGMSVNWLTGQPTGKAVRNPKEETHCSAFAAAAAKKFGVYLLRPPEHSDDRLANAQRDWLLGAGTNNGWSAVSSPIQAQQLANAGELVVVTFKTADPKKHGHIAIVRPSTKSDEQILAEGPEIIQSGAQNFVRTTVKEGFKHHPGAFENHELLYFAHPIQAGI
jgi:hypothetical protein